MISGSSLPLACDVVWDEAQFGAIAVPVAGLVPIEIAAGALAGVMPKAGLSPHSSKAGLWIGMLAVTDGMTSLSFFLLGEAGQGLIVGTLVDGILSGGFLVELARASLPDCDA